MSLFSKFVDFLEMHCSHGGIMLLELVAHCHHPFLFDLNILAGGASAQANYEVT